MSTTEDNTIAIAELVVIAKQTTKDVDRVIKHLDEAPIARTIALEKRMAKVELRLPHAISKSVIMWGVAIALTGLFSFVGFTYTIVSTKNDDFRTAIANLNEAKASHNAQCIEHKQNLLRRLVKLELSK